MSDTFLIYLAKILTFTKVINICTFTQVSIWASLFNTAVIYIGSMPKPQNIVSTICVSREYPLSNRYIHTRHDVCVPGMWMYQVNIIMYCCQMFLLINTDNFVYLLGSTQIPSCPGSFPCDNRTCVNMLKVCNGNPDCPRGEDELLCGEFL